MKLFLNIFSVLILFTNISTAAVFTSVAAGDFDLPATWGNLDGQTPGASDDVIIKHYVFVNLSNKKTIQSLSLYNDGAILAGLAINGSDSLVVLNNVLARAYNQNKDLFLSVNNSATFIINGNCDFERIAGNATSNFLQLKLNNNSKTFIKGIFTFNYAGSGAGESEKEVTIFENALLEVEGETRIFASAGNDFNLGMYGTSQAYFRDSLTLELTGTAMEAGITLHNSSKLDLYSSAYLYNSSTTSNDFAKLRVRSDSSKLYIQGSVYLESFGAGVKLEAEGQDGEVTVGGDIIMNASAQGEVYINIIDHGEIFLAGQIIRETNYGNLTMAEDAAFIFNGTSPQVLPESKLSDSGTDFLNFRKLRLENTSIQPFLLSEDVIIEDSLILKYGNLVTDTSAMIVLQDSAVISGSSSAYVEGPVRKLGTTAGQDITIPIGTSKAFAPITISAISDPASEVTVQYFSEPPPFGIEYRDASIDNVSDNRYWTVEKNTSAGDLDITLTWQDSVEAGVSDVNDLLVVGWDGSEWQNYGNESATVVGSGGNVTSLFSEPPPFGIQSFTIGSSSPSNALPIELIDFQVIPNNQKVFMQWRTVSEINANRFVVERSNDGQRFEKIYTVDSRGSIDQFVDYYARDLMPFVGYNYYRLKMIDNDNTYEYSEILAVKINSYGTAIVYPNPVIDEFVIHIADWSEESVNFEVFDSNSRKIFEEKISLSSREYRAMASDINVISSGTYIIKITGAVTSKIVKFVKVE